MTPIQECINKFNEDGVGFTDWFLENYEYLLEKEHEQLYESYLDGMRDESER